MHRARALIDLDAVRHNFHEVRCLTGKAVKIWPAVKSNGYGHGAVPVVRALVEAGADGFCVATPEEAQEIGPVSGGMPVLLLGAAYTEDIPSILALGVETTIVDVSFAQELSMHACKSGRRVRVHLKMDTGMGRIGVPTDSAVEVACEINRLPGLELVGLMTHFPSSDERDLTFAWSQAALFNEVCNTIQCLTKQHLNRHAANTGAILGLPDAYFDTVRPGIMIYGCFPSSEVVRSANLQPVMTLSSRISFLKDTPAGMSVSYGRTWTTRRPSKIATVNIGYGDGLPRSLSNKGVALVHGQNVPIVGRVCMDQTMLDVTDIPTVSIGDDVVFWGKQGDTVLHAEQVAEAVGTIAYELTCGVTCRVPRVYI